MSSSSIPYVEFYRPTKFDDIILDPLNKQILVNIIETSYFPNLLFYGPPGTGKTTTIINLVNAYQEKLNQEFVQIFYVQNHHQDHKHKPFYHNIIAF